MMDQQITVAVLAILFVAVMIASRFAGGGGRIRLTKQAWGTVYVFNSPTEDGVHKVGFTRRSVAVRRREVSQNMAGGRDIRTIFVVDTHFPEDVERRAHWLLRQKNIDFSGAEHRRGVEWFHGDARAKTDALLAACADVRAEAIRRRKWPETADARVKAVRWEGRKRIEVRPFAGR